MKVIEERLALHNGAAIPKLGLGTWFIPDDQAEKAVCQATLLGYRHVDTAQAYNNEQGVGHGIRSCGIPRDQLFVTDKVAAGAKSYAEAAASIDESLTKMGLDYLDLLLIHSPQPWGEWRGEKRYFDENKEVWCAMEDACHAGKVKSIGVSNFLQDDLESLLQTCSIQPAVNQLLVHIGNTPLSLMAFCREHHILVEAYSPIAHGEALKNEAIAAMAAQYGVSVSQLCIRYVLQLGCVALPKTANPLHMAENTQVDFEISNKDMETLKRLSFREYGEYSHFPVFSNK